MNCPFVAVQLKVAPEMEKPVALGTSFTPGVEDITGEYRGGEASIVSEGVSITGMLPPGDKDLIPHVPSTHSQLPAPQSRGPWQTAVHIMSPQDGALVFNVQLVG